MNKFPTLEVVAKLRFSRNSGSFEPIFASFRVGYIRNVILPTRKEAKIGQNNPEFRRTLSFATTSLNCAKAPRFDDRKEGNIKINMAFFAIVKSRWLWHSLKCGTYSFTDPQIGRLR